MRISTIIGAVFLLQFTSLAQSVPPRALAGHVPAAVAGLAPTGRLEAGRELHLAIGLPWRNREGLTNLLQRIYDPASPDYHHYLTPAEFAEQFGPSEDDYRAVREFAAANGLTVTMTHSNRAVLDVSGSVSNIEQALHVNLHTYRHPRESREFYAPDREPSLDLATPVLHISGLDNYVVPRPMSLQKTPAASRSGAVPASGSGPNGAYMGNDFRAAYVPGTALTGAGQSIGLLEFDSGFYQSDITAYEAAANLPNVPVKPVLLDSYDGSQGNDNDEVSLDIETAISMAPGLASVLVYEGDTTDDILNRMATDNLAKQLSASWTYGIDAESDQIFQEFAAQGQSFFNASGDTDAYAGTTYPPAPPTDDPNLTCVGGTTLTTSGPGGAWVSETVWNWGVEYAPNDDGIGSSGGISVTNPIPAWQAGVSMTLNHGSSTLRNLPDVALTADNVFVISAGGSTGSFGGTSCATPLWAAFMALVNQQATASGHNTLGFVNPAIYAIARSASYASCFHDITTGSNTWSASPSNFRAVSGYDLCTGWGTPTGTNLINQLAPLDALQVSPPNGFSASGGVGGPLAPAAQTYVLNNIGTATLNWAAATTASWLNISLTSGTLTPGGTPVTMVVSLNQTASNLFLGTYAATLFITNLTDGAVQSRPFTLTIIRPPYISAQPASVTAIGGSTVTFSAGAAGGLPLYGWWQLNGTNLANGGRISGAATNLGGTGNIYGSFASTLTISNAGPADAGTYSLVASNAAGVTASVNAVLTMSASGPVITSQPASQSVLLGVPVELAVTVEGTAPFTYQWRQNGTNLTDGAAFSGSATPILTINSASSASIGTYTVHISNLISTTTSTGAMLSVVVALPGGSLVQNGGFETGNFAFWGESGNFVDCTVSPGVPAAHSGNYGALLGPAGALGYLSQTLPTVPGQVYLLSLWLDSPDGASPNEFLVGWNGIPVFDQTDLGNSGWTNLQFYVTATGTNTVLEFGFQDDESFLGLDDIQVTTQASANGPPIIATQPANQVGQTGGTASFSVLSAGRLPLAYQWRFDGTNLANATNTMLTLTNLAVSQAGLYSVVVTNVLGLATSSNATLTVLTGSPTVITFDDLPGTSVAVPAGYNSLTWSNLYSIDGVTYGQPSGYTAGVVSSPNVVYDGYGGPATISSPVAFDLLSAYLTAAWNDNLLVEFKGYSGTTLAYDNTYTLSATVPKLIQFNYLGITSVEIIPSGGSRHPGYTGSGEHFAMDNVSIFMPPSPPVITNQPVSQTVTVGGSVTLGVGVTGTAPLSYLWSRNGGGLAGATNSIYVLNNAQLTDSGAQFSCLVSNAYGMVTSSNAVVTVINPPGSTLLDEGNLAVTITNFGGRISSLMFKGIELYQVGFFLSDWGLQTGTNSATFVVNQADSGDIGQPMTLVTATTNSVAYTGTYTAGGANVAVQRTYTLVPGVDVLDTRQTFTNLGTAAINLVTFDTFDPDWQLNGVDYYAMYAHRYTLSADGVSIQVGRGVMTNDGTTILVGTTDAAAVLAACETSYFGIQSSSNLNTLISTGGADSGGAVVDDSLDIARGLTLAPGAGASFEFYQSFASSVGTAELALEMTATGASNFPPVITGQPASQTVVTGGTATFGVAASGSAPLGYYWRSNAVPIPGANATSYTLNTVQLSESGAQFSCLVSNAYGTALSSNAVLEVFAPATGGVAVYGAPGTAAWNSDVTGNISNTLLFSQVTGFLAGAGEATPTLAQLEQYSAVLVYSDATFNDNVGMGNVLADYADAGGGVVIASFGLNANSFGIAGRLLTGGYLPLTTGTQTSGTELTLVADQPTHPILHGVASFDGGTASYHNLVTTNTGANLIAHWTDGEPLVATKQLTAGRVVALNFYPPSSNARSDFWLAGTGGGQLMANALLWSGGGGVVISNATLDHFAWNTIASPQGAGAPFATTLTAQGALGQTVTSFTGTVALGISGGVVATNLLFEGVSPTSSSTGTYTWGYEFTPTNNLVVTALSSYFGTNVSLWTGAGTLLASEYVSAPSGVWSETPLATPVALAAGSNYVVAAFVSSSTYYWVTNLNGEFPDGVIATNSVFDGSEVFPTLVDGAWPLVGLRYTTGTAQTLTLTPATAGPFTNGVWTGSLTVQQPGSNVVVIANDGAGHAGSSNPFNVLAVLAATNLVQNGGFELGTFADWTLSGNENGVLVGDSAPYVHSGLYGAELGPVTTLGYLSQTIATSAGQQYQISCWLYSGGSFPNEFSVAWNGVTLFDQADVGDTLWTNLQFTANATTSNTVLTFGFRNDPSYLGLDDIVVSAVPATPQFQSVTLTNGTISFGWSALAGQLYQVQWTTNLTQAAWVNLTGILTATNTTMKATDILTASPRRFYRLVLWP
jgi:hypothetical protein